MYFSINYDNGYIVTVTKIWDNGYMQSKPLRKFEEQGEALAFRDFDCPQLKETEIKILIKQYKPNIKYKRISNKQFKIYENCKKEEYNWHNGIKKGKPTIKTNEIEIILEKDKQLKLKLF